MAADPQAMLNLWALEGNSYRPLDGANRPLMGVSFFD